MINQQSAEKKTTYLSMVENRYVFNLSLLFWHLFIALSTLAIVISLLVFLWSIIPASHKTVEKSAYPAKSQYPEPVRVTLGDLATSGAKDEAPPPTPEPIQAIANTVERGVQDTKGLAGYDSAMNALKTLIPPATYSWRGSGIWTYPLGERYWTVYKQERYRQWNATEPSVDDRLSSAFQKAGARDYADKKRMIEAYNGVLRGIAEDKRLPALQVLLSNVANSVSQNEAVCASIAKVVTKMGNDDGPGYINQLATFGRYNPNDGASVIDYIASIIDRFAPLKRSEIIARLLTGYTSFFGHRLTMLKEATDLFLPMLPQIQPENQATAIVQYYGLFRNKNYARDSAIAQIEGEYQAAAREIDQQFALDQLAAESQFLLSKQSKSKYRLKSLAGIGGGVLLIVLVAVILVFFSIQRSVRRIEDRIALDTPAG